MFKKIVCFCLVLLSIFAISGCSVQTEYEKFKKYSFDFFDTATTIIGYEKSSEEFDAVCEEIFALLEEYHKLYDIYTRYEGINNLVTVNSLNNGEHSVVKVDEKIIEMLNFSREIYKLTDGYVNVAMGSVLSIWHDYRTYGERHPSEATLPSPDMLRAAAEHTDIEDIIIDSENNTVFLADAEMSLDVGAVAKGYAVEQVAIYLQSKGKEGYILNVGGNVRIVGSRPDGEKWTVGIENPYEENGDEEYIAYLSLEDMSVVTSGSYQRYYVVDGVNYHHIINPDTLMPGENYLSVSVVCRDSGLGDGLSTALFSMPFEKGYELISSLDSVEAMWVFPDGTQKYSSGFQNYFKD